MTNRKKRILVVDDSKDLQETIRLVLTDSGYDVFSALSGEEGLQKTKELNPDLILLDFMWCAIRIELHKPCPT